MIATTKVRFVGFKYEDTNSTEEACLPVDDGEGQHFSVAAQCFADESKLVFCLAFVRMTWHRAGH